MRTSSGTHRGLALVALFALASSACVRRSSSPTADRSDGTIPSVHATHLDANAIHIDGRLDEPAWQRAGQTGAFVDPGQGHARRSSDVNATARIAWDDTNLYLGVIVDDRNPASPFNRTDVDPHLWERASAIEVMLQPGDLGDNRDYYELQVDVNGAVWDTHFDDYNRPITMAPDGQRFGHQAWESEVQRAVTIDRSAGHYTIEVAWPWRSIVNARVAVPPHAGDTWRVNLYSFRDGQRDSMAWSPLQGQGNFHRSSRFGRVTF
jgi:hypothetical protein